MTRFRKNHTCFYRATAHPKISNSSRPNLSLHRNLKFKKFNWNHGSFVSVKQGNQKHVRCSRRRLSLLFVRPRRIWRTRPCPYDRERCADTVVFLHSILSLSCRRCRRRPCCQVQKLLTAPSQSVQKEFRRDSCGLHRRLKELNINK